MYFVVHFFNRVVIFVLEQIMQWHVGFDRLQISVFGVPQHLFTLASNREAQCYVSILAACYSTLLMMVSCSHSSTFVGAEQYVKISSRKKVTLHVHTHCVT